MLEKINKNFIETLLIELTQKCNLNCQYCFYRDYGRSEDEIGIAQLEKILAEYPNLKNIFFTGGECTLNKNFIDIIKKASEKATVTLFTNGLSFIDNNFLIETDKYVSKYIITYDEYDENYFCRDKIKETDTVLKEILKISPEKLIVKICINKYNKNNLENIINYLINIGVKKISINLIHNINSNDKNFELTTEEMKEVFGILDGHREVLDINWYEELKRFFINGEKLIVKNCLAGKKFLYYSCDGKLNLCPAYGVESKECISKECVSLFEMF